jgi:hypothetical protein
VSLEEKAIMREGCESEEFARGRALAVADIAAGLLRYRRHGHPGPWGQDFADLMATRLGVRVEETAGCLVNPALVSFDDGYNEAVLQEIARIYGPDAFPALVAEAKATAKERHNRYFTKQKTGHSE